MTLFNILYMLCLGGVIFSFCGVNFGIPYLSNYVHSKLVHDFGLNFKVNHNDDTEEGDTSMQTNHDKISVGGNHRPMALQDINNLATDDNVPNVIQSMKEHLRNPKELQSIGNALGETVSTILSNDMLRKAFVEDLRGITTMEALHDLFKTQNTPVQQYDSEQSTDSDD